MDAPPPDDSAEAVREWRWRSYRDHLEDLGYDLDGGSASDAATNAGTDFTTTDEPSTSAA